MEAEVDISARIRRFALGGMAGISTVLSLRALVPALDWRSGAYAGAVVAVWMTLLLGLQLRHCARALGPSSGSFPAASLLLQSFLVLVPLPVMRDEWAGISGLLAGTFLITVRGGTAWVLEGAVGVAQAGAVLADAHAVGATSLSVLVTGSTGVSFLSVACLARLAERLQAARGEDARLAVVNERLRFARDLHDLIGYSLSTAATKSELAYRLVEHSPGRARAELSQVIEVIRGTHAEVRKVAHDHHHLSLDRELESARSVLEAAGIDPRFSSLGVDFTHRASSVLAAVLREGISNVLRHSTADYCVVRLFRRNSSVTLLIINNGPTPARDVRVSSPGVGLPSLSERVAALGGDLRVSRRGTGERAEFRLEAVVPDTVTGLPGGLVRGRRPVRAKSRLIPWTPSDPAFRHRDPDGVDSVSGT
ncbi:sensor histidine kinase [Streptomyces scabiei]|uniref:sensor histidine kinase n=1 Tax=Streptomyces scabiei TaxID=1930 RepID=UPI00131A944E|nr:histidine kinase [Streptomyces scabiei]